MLLVTGTFKENSEVSPVVLLVAVMLTLFPTSGTSEVQLKVGESPLASVVPLRVA